MTNQHSLEFKYYPAHGQKGVPSGMVPYWLGNPNYVAKATPPRDIRRIWQEISPKTDIGFVSMGASYRLLALPKGTKAKDRAAFLQKMLEKSKFSPDPWPFPKPQP